MNVQLPNPCLFGASQVKCDGRPNGCRNCERLQLDCVGDNGLTASRNTPMALRKIRTYRSCKSCRLSKTKCNGDRPKCSRCNAKKTECVYDGGSAPRWARNMDPGARADGSRSKSRELAALALLAEGSDEAEIPQLATPLTSNGSAEPQIPGEVPGLGSLQSVASIEPSGSDIFSWYVKYCTMLYAKSKGGALRWLFDGWHDRRETCANMIPKACLTKPSHRP